jgi:putative transposase
MDERLKFIARLLDGEKMAGLCREFGISRKTGYKILTRYNEIGLQGLTDRSRRPYRHANQLPLQIETQIVRLKQDKPNWGAPKIREKLSRLYPDVHTPAISTVHVVLDRHGLVKRRVRRRNRAKGTVLSVPSQPNDLWCADYKGEFMLADRRYCYPLTITDFASRYLFACEALDTTKEAYAFPVFEAVFKEFGLPKAIRTDNGVPFASPNSLFNLSKLSVWWLRLGIEIERIKPGHPQQNGRHERMHLTLKLETTKPAGKNFLQQQAKFDEFIDCYNRASEHPSCYVIEGKRLCWPGCDPAGYLGFCRARSVIDRAADVVSAARAKIHGPSARGWIASISPASAASRSVLGATCRSFAALVRLSHGSIPSSAGLNTGIR